jgi:hypothetical protein
MDDKGETVVPETGVLQTCTPKSRIGISPSPADDSETRENSRQDGRATPDTTFISFSTDGEQRWFRSRLELSISTTYPRSV